MSAGPRLAALLARRGPLVAMALLVVGVGALAGAGWVYTHPPTTQVTDRVHEQTVRTEGSTGAVVTGNTSLYPRGARLTDEPVYLLPAASTLWINRTTTVPEGRPVDVTQRLELVYRVNHGGETFWRERRLLTREETTTRSGQVRTSARLSVTRIRERRSEIAREVGGAGQVTVLLRLRVDYRTDRYEGRFLKRAPLRIHEGWYAFDPPSASRTHGQSRARTVVVPSRRGTTHVVLGGLGALAVVAALGAATLYLGRYRDADPAVVQYRLDRSRYAEWISAGTLPDVGDRTTVSVASLEDLVDVGIDTDRRVVYDSDRETYALIDDGVVYRYAPDAADGEWPGDDPTVEPAEADQGDVAEESPPVDIKEMFANGTRTDADVPGEDAENGSHGNSQDEDAGNGSHGESQGGDIWMDVQPDHEDVPDGTRTDENGRG